MTLSVESLGRNTWKTKDSKKLKWSDMSDRHLLNTANMLDSMAEDELGAYWSFSPRGDAATYAWECAQSEVEDNANTWREIAALMRWYVKNRGAVALMRRYTEEL